VDFEGNDDGPASKQHSDFNRSESAMEC